MPGGGLPVPDGAGGLLCDTHQDRYRARNDIRAHKGIEPASVETYLGFVRAERERAAGAYVLRPVSGTLRLELQYLLQHEADIGRQVNPRRFNDLVELLSPSAFAVAIEPQCG